MLIFFFRKLLAFILLFFFLVSAVLVLQKSREGSVALVLSGQRSNQAELQKLQELSGENLNTFEHLLLITKNILRLDFGNTATGRPVITQVWQAFSKTFVLSVFAALFALLYGIIPGIFGHYYKNLRKPLQNLNYGVLASPIFIIALVLLWIFSLYFQWFPPGGVDSWVWFFLPGIALGLKSGAQIYLFTDELIQRELSKKYVNTAVAYGYARSRIFSRFIFKNISLPLFSFWLLELGSYFAGAAIVETIFSIPGIGSLLLKALMRYDINLLIGILVFVSVLFFLITLIQEWMDKIYARFAGATNDE